MPKRKLQVIDTMDLMNIIKNPDGTSRTLFTAETTKTSLKKEMQENVEIYSGIGSNKTFELKGKPNFTLDANIASFDLDFLAYKNGVELDETSKKSYHLRERVSLSTNTATLSKTSRVISVQTIKGVDMQLTTSTPSADQIQYTKSGEDIVLTTEESFKDDEILVTYEGETANNVSTITMSGQAVPRGCELLGKTIVYDTETNEVVADIFINFYKATPSADYDLSFEMGTPIEIPIEYTILKPEYLPDGTVNDKAVYGKMSIQWK